MSKERGNDDCGAATYSYAACLMFLGVAALNHFAGEDDDTTGQECSLFIFATLSFCAGMVFCTRAGINRYEIGDDEPTAPTRIEIKEAPQEKSDYESFVEKTGSYSSEFSSKSDPETSHTR